MDIYLRNALNCSKKTTLNYSTSFSLGVRMFKKDFRPAIYAIYGFVRFADEIVDTFIDQNREQILEEFVSETYKATEDKFSTNPIIHSFQWVVNKYGIDKDHIEDFIKSMKMDINKTRYSKDEYKRYIYGSAEVVGLMCLKIFYHNNDEEYNRLKYYACKLGEAFQKVNFLRDIHSDYHHRKRVYFPGMNFEKFDNSMKNKIEEEIEQDFNEAYIGLKRLNKDMQLGVLVAYSYYKKLFQKICKNAPETLREKRLRISNLYKIMLMMKCYFRYKLNML